MSADDLVQTKPNMREPLSSVRGMCWFSLMVSQRANLRTHDFPFIGFRHFCDSQVYISFSLVRCEAFSLSFRTYPLSWHGMLSIQHNQKRPIRRR